MFTVSVWKHCVLARNLTKFSFRSLSSTSSSGAVKAYPQYTLYGTDCMFSINTIPPLFKHLPNGGLVQDTTKKGKLLLKWLPRNAEGYFRVENNIQFSLTAEEVGLVIDQLPDHQVEFSRSAPPEYGINSGSSPEQPPEKVFRMIPQEGGGVSFTVDYELNGLGGQSPAHEGTRGPLNVTAQRGEVRVLLEIMRWSLPALTGWSTMMEQLLRHSVETAQKSKGGGRAPSSSTEETYDVPF